MRRRSPNGQEGREDWPVLRPKRSASPGTLQQMMASTGSQLTQQATSAEKERYPVLGNITLRQVPDNDQLPISRFSASHKIPRKEVSSPSLRKPVMYRSPARSNNDTDDPFRDGIYNTNLATAVNGLPNSPSGLSAAAAAVEKSSREKSKADIEPRQTRTASLRARLSAGQLVKDDHNKVVGFTDFTAPSEPASNSVRRDSLRARKEAQSRRSITPPVAPAIQPKPSRESLGGNRAPAQFVAGSRRPAHPRRPSSRGSLYNAPRATSPSLPPLPPSRLAPTRPISQGPGTETSIAKNAGVSQPAPGTNLPPRRSSIPVPRLESNNSTPSGLQNAPSIQKDVNYPQARKAARVEAGIYEDRLTKDLVKELQPSTLQPNFSEILRPSYDDQDTNALEAIEESPQHAYQLKRLSLNTSGFGPTLRISPHAEGFIMGPKPNDGEQSLNKKKSKELERAMMRDDIKERKENTKPISTKKTTERPSSSQGLPRLAPRVGLVDPKVREKKAKSADLSIPSPKGEIQQTFIKPMLEKLSNIPQRGSKPSSTASCNDPFFDALEQPQRASKEVKIPVQAESKREVPIDEAAWISPLKKKASGPDEDGVLVLDGHLPPSLRQQFEDDLKMEAKQSVEGDPFRDVSIRAVPVNGVLRDSKTADVTIEPHTPERPIIKNRNVSGNGTLPPRSSSRTTHPDFTGDKTHKPSPLTTENMRKGPPTPSKDSQTPSKDFESVKNSLGSRSGHASTQLDIRKLVSNRASAGGDSYKSQGSVSKSMLSSMRGLFHKRSSENEPFKSSKKNKSKVNIQANGSPFPPISEVHPIHRPTLASMARSNAATPRAGNVAPPPTPSYASPLPSEVSTTTTLAMQILESARNEHSSPKKERLLELGKIMVDAITQARDAEKAMEEAKQAARKAEVSYVMCKKSLGEVERCVKEWRNDIGR